MFNRKIWTISKKIHTPYEWMFWLWWWQEYEKEVTWTGYIDLTYAIANKLLELKAYGWTEQRNIPSWYTQVEYLEVVTSGVYFRTGINADINTEMEITASNISSSSAQLMVADCSSGMDYFRIAKASASQRIIGSVGSETVTDNNTVGINKFTAQVNKIGLYIDGTLIGAFTNPPSSFTDIGEIRIFSGKYSGSEYFAYNESKLYGAKIRQNGVLVGDYIPCRNSSNVLGLYDKVTNTFLTESGTGTFTAGADVVPTPANPMDIVSNNGAVKVRNKSWLPLGYQRVEYLESSGTQYINTGIVPDNDTGFSVTLQCVNTPTDNFIYGAREGATGRFVVGAESDKLYFGYGALTNMVTDAWNNCVPENKNNVKLNYKNSKIAQVNNSQDVAITNTLPEFDTNTTITLFGRKYNGTVVCFAQRVYDNEITQGNNVIRNYIPCRRNSDNVLGMYETVTNTFLTNAWTWTFTAGAIDDELEIYTAGTTETIEDSLGNTATAERLLKVQDYTDTQEILSGVVTRNVGITILRGTETWNKSSTYTGSFYTSSYSPDSGAKVGSNPNCLCTHGVKVNNLEEYASAGAGACYWYSAPTINYKYDNGTATVDQFKQWLKDQYNAWTPVMIVYPLATSTTESVAWQTMNIQQGTNTIEITQASINNLQLYAKYKSSKQ